MKFYITLLQFNVLLFPRNTYQPRPVDHLQLLVQVGHEDGEDEDGENHLADGHRWVAAGVRRRIADQDDQADELRKKGSYKVER